MTNDIELIIVAGFLGSGKTTLLLQALGQPDASDTAVIVNEAGEISIDGIILEDSGAPVPMAFLSNGCVCCSIGSELLTTIEALILSRERLSLPPLNRIIVETSGLSKPGPILRQLGALARHRIRVQVVAALDCTRSAQMLAHNEAVAQLAGAATIVLTKLDLAAPEEVRATIARATAVNPLARIICDVDPAARSEALFASSGEMLLETLLTENSMPASAHPDILVWCRELTEPPTLDEVLAWTDNLAGVCGDRLLRLKGSIRTEDGAGGLLLQSVGTTFSAPRPLRRAPERSVLVAIARNMTADEIAAVTPALGWMAPRHALPCRQTRSSPVRWPPPPPVLV